MVLAVFLYCGSMQNVCNSASTSTDFIETEKYLESSGNLGIYDGASDSRKIDVSEQPSIQICIKCTKPGCN